MVDLNSCNIDLIYPRLIGGHPRETLRREDNRLRCGHL